ncbi:MAG: hypothetical protein LC623_04455, partial [Halobacteriales archaeon]|nr:hypothetical protein [Halobacteriales archaeon]
CGLRPMPRPRRNAYTKKERVGVTPDPVLMNWVLQRVGPGKQFASITHAFECGIVALQEKEKRHA